MHYHPMIEELARNRELEIRRRVAAPHVHAATSGRTNIRRRWHRVPITALLRAARVAEAR